MVVFTILIASALAMGTVFAEWAAITSGYAVTTKWHGVDVSPGEEVTAWAGTTDSSVTKVKFIWLDPSENEVSSQTVDVFGPYTTPTVPPDAIPEIVEWANKNEGETIYYATSDPFPIPDLLGDWAVKAYFQRPGADPPPEEECVMVRATSYNVIPEVPIVGTIGAAAVILLSIGFFTLRNRKVF